MVVLVKYLKKIHYIWLYIKEAFSKLCADVSSQSYFTICDMAKSN